MTKATSKKAPQTPFNLPLFGLIGYANSNYDNNSQNRKSVIGNCFFIHEAIIFWCSKKQQTVSNSITKTKYIALEYAA